MNKNDLRYLKTEANLKQAYLTLLKTHTQTQITVKLICQTAQCSRNTFYLHYAVKENLPATIMDEVLGSLAKAFVPHAESLEQIDGSLLQTYIDRITAAIIAHREALTVMIANDDGVFYQRFTQTITQTMQVSLKSLSDANHNELTKLYLVYLSAAVAGFVFQWLSSSNTTDVAAKQALSALHLTTMATVRQLLQASK